MAAGGPALDSARAVVGAADVVILMLPGKADTEAMAPAPSKPARPVLPAGHPAGQPSGWRGLRPFG